jgi:7,8-dihydroneopterin aldolase/epimerase/oxygenase
VASHLISVSGVVVRGRHGVNPEERDEPQDFRVDLEAEVDVRADALDATADYRTLVDVARETVESTSVELLEFLANTVASALAALPAVMSVRVTVHKPAAARSLGVDDVSAMASARGAGSRRQGAD